MMIATVIKGISIDNLLAGQKVEWKKALAIKSHDLGSIPWDSHNRMGELNSCCILTSICRL